MESTPDIAPVIRDVAKFGGVTVTDVNGTKIVHIAAKYVTVMEGGGGVHATFHLNGEEWTDLLGAMWQAMQDEAPR